MTEDITYIANYLGLNVNNKFTLLDLGEIKDTMSFIIFMKKNINHSSLQYLNALQKLEQLKKLQEKELNQEREIEAQTKAQQLADKFREIKYLLVDEIEKYKKPTIEMLKVNGVNHFTAFEISQLNAIGNTKELISLSNEFLLEDKIEKNYIKLIYKKQNIAITKKDTKQVSLNVKRF